MQCDSSATTKSARVKYPSTNCFSPTNLLSCSSFALYFSSTPALAVSWSLWKQRALTAPAISTKTERKLSIWALSSMFLPRSYCAHCSQMQRWMALESVRVQRPWRRQGRLGKSMPILCLSSLNHCSVLLQQQSSNCTPEYASSSLGTCASPLMAQQPSLTLRKTGLMGTMGGRKGSETASGREQQALTPSSCSKLSLILHQKAYCCSWPAKMVSKQQRYSARQKSARVRQPTAKGFSPTNCLRLSSFGWILGRISDLRGSE